MTEAIVKAVEALNTMSPLAIIGLLSLILYINVWKQPTKRELNTIKSNDLHELPEMAETLRRMEHAQTVAFATIIAKLNGRSR